MGPTIFTLYTSDHVASIQSGTICTPTTPVTISCIGKTIDRCVKSIPKRFVYLICEEQVDTTPKEIRTMLIDRGWFTGPIPPLYLGGNSLGLVTHSRLLGVIIDNKWGWSIHI